MRFASRDHPALVVAAGYGLGVARATDVAAVHVGVDELDSIRVFCRTDRISGLLAGAVREGSIVVGSGSDVPDSTMAIDDDWHVALHACVLIEALLVRVAERLDAIGVRWMVTKGPAVAHLDYPDPALRTFADIDLVIHPADWEVVLDLLDGERAGSARTSEFVKRYGKGRTVMVDDMEVDLHLRFAVGRFGVRSRLEECFARTESIVLGGRRVPTPSADHRLLHACHHAVLGGSAELRAFRDVAQLASGSPETVERTWETARSWGVEAVVATAVLETWRRLRLSPDHPVAAVARQVDVTRADRRALTVFEGRDRFRNQALTTLSALPVRERPWFAYSAWRMSRERRR